ncbi:MAG: hypothetical protein ACSHYA_18405 [Opitutaceae bacterium]
MIDEKFSELVNLYLDKEISSEDLEILKAELESNSARKAEFQDRCRLHQAMRLAMGAPQSASSEPRRVRSKPSGRSRASSSPSSRRSSRKEFSGAASLKLDESSQGSNFPRWIPALGLAACFAIGGLFLYPVFTDTIHVSQQPLEGISEAEIKAIQDPMSVVEDSDLKRFVINQRRVVRRNSSLAAELRLLGLHPEVMDAEEVELREVSLASTQPRDLTRRRIVLFNQLKEYTPLPEPAILETAEPKSRSSQWPSGFQVSLASFK